MNLSIYSQSQQHDAMTRAVGVLSETKETHVGPASIMACCALTGIDVSLLMEIFEENMPDPDGSDPRSLCEGVLLGIAFTLELQEG